MASHKFVYYTTHHYPKLLQLYYLKYDLPHKRTFADAYVDTRWLSNRVKFVLAYYHRLWSGAWKINWVLVLLRCQEWKNKGGTRISGIYTNWINSNFYTSFYMWIKWRSCLVSLINTNSLILQYYKVFFCSDQGIPQSRIRNDLV